jgi:signal transduction histidine kinase
MKVRSLTRQTVTIVLTAQVLCALALSGLAVIHEGHTRLHAFDVRLQGRSDSLLGAIQDAEDPDSTVRIDPAELKLPDEDVFAVYSRGGSILGNSINAPAPLISRAGDGFRDVSFNGVHYRVLQREALRVIDRAEYGSDGLKRPVTILYASPETHIWHEIFRSASFSLLAIFLAAALTACCVVFFLRRALQPLSDLAVAAAQLSPPSLEFEPPPSVLQLRELRPLAAVLSGAVARLREAFEKEHRFVGDAAHELKTAIAVVRSSVQLLMLKRRTPDEYALGLERVLEDNIRVETLTAQMLQLARMEESSKESLTPLDLGEAVKQVVSQLEPVAAERNLEFQSDCPPGMMVRLSQHRAEVLISNLLMNAIQHSHPRTSVVVCVRGQRSGDIALEIADSGTGIGKDALPHIFERFYREDRSRSRDTGGAGLGLAICKSIVEAAGGTIRIASQTEIGTTVTVVFSGA